MTPHHSSALPNQQPVPKRLGIYVHWPFCTRICPYCDFNVYKDRSIETDAWREAMAREIDYWFERTRGRALQSLYFGGGTPGLMSPTLVGDIIEACAERWGFVDTPEITLEANPDQFDAERQCDMAQAGINRLSLGVQSFRDTELAFLGRDHDGATARTVIEAAVQFFPRLTFDMIYGMLDQSPEDWSQALQDALTLANGHLSLYQLTIEPGTAFAKAVDRGALIMPDDDVLAVHFDIARQQTEARGYEHYEISNFATPGHQAVHNRLYWETQDYIGIGPGAHGRLSGVSPSQLDGLQERHRRFATENIRHWKDWLAHIQHHGHGCQSETLLSGEDIRHEYLLMGMRLQEGCSIADDPYFQTADKQEVIRQLIDDELLVDQPGRLVATQTGRGVLDRLIYQLLT